MLRSVPVGVLAAVLLLLPDAVRAAPACDSVSPEPRATVTPHLLCQTDPSLGGDPPLEEFLAADFFGFGSWMLEARSHADRGPDGLASIDTTGPEGNRFDFAIDGDSFSGNWSFQPKAGFITMLVLGEGEPDLPDALVAYWVTGPSGDYAISEGEIGQISLWSRWGGNILHDDDEVGFLRDETGLQTPLPAAGWMLVTALAALGLLGRRRAG